MKELLGKHIASLVQNNQIIGVGTGSTVDASLQAIAEKIRTEKLQIKVVPTSYQTAWSCEQLGLTVLGMPHMGELDWGFDGADAVDDALNLIKGKGAAMLEEKILAKKCKKYFVIVDETKLCKDICQKCAVPVEVIPSAHSIVQRALQKLGATEVTIRNAVSTKHGPVITERGNIILDATFSAFRKGLEQEIKSITGVVENGIFEGCVDEVLVAKGDGTVQRISI